MLEIVDQKIKISQGDTFDVTFNLDGYTASANDKFIFSIKQTIFGEVLLKKEFTNITGDTLHIVVTAAEMNKLPAGVYLYDLHIENGAEKFTLNYPEKLIIEAVVHE